MNNKKFNLSAGLAASSASSDVDPFQDGSGLALYKFDGTADDDGGNYNGTWSGTTRYATGKIDQGADFQGSLNDYISLGTNFGLHSINFSISFWVYATNTGNNQFWITSNGSGTTCHTNLHIGRDSSNGVLKFGTFCSDVKSSASMNYNVWEHWTLTYNRSSGGERKIYKNGNLDVTQTQSQYVGTDNIQIGGGRYWFGGGDPTYAILDQVRFFNKVLSASEVYSLYISIDI